MSGSAGWRLTEGVPEEDVRQLLTIARRRRFSRQEVVFHRDDPGDSMHLVVMGRFGLQIMTPLGDTATVGVRGPGDSFGELALVNEQARRSATVVALRRPRRSLSTRTSLTACGASTRA